MPMYHESRLEFNMKYRIHKDLKIKDSRIRGVEGSTKMIKKDKERDQEFKHKCLELKIKTVCVISLI